MHLIYYKMHHLMPSAAILIVKSRILGYSMAAILENGGHFGILRGPRFFHEKWPL